MRKSERSKISTVGQFWCKRGICHALHEEIGAQQDIDRRSESKLKGKAEVMWFPLFLFFDTCNKIKKIRFSHTSLTGYPTYRLFDKQGRMHHLNWPPE